MKTTIIVCPYAQFGNPGTQRGAELLGDAVRELLDDNRHERRPTRGDAFRDKVRIKELPLDTPAHFESWHKSARGMAKDALDSGDLLIWIGGNHLSVMPLYEELGARSRSLIVQFDAHLDIYHHDDTKQELSHGNFIRHLHDPRPKVVNIGHRDQFLLAEEIHEHFDAAVGAIALDNDRVEKTLAAGIRRADRVAIDIDWDVLDPAYFPAVDDALPFGLSPQQLLRHMQAIWSGKTCAVAFSEFNPSRDDHDRSLQLAVWFVEQVLLWRHEGV